MTLETPKLARAGLLFVWILGLPLIVFTAAVVFEELKVEVFSDAARETLGLHTVDAHVIDATGRTYNRDMLAEAELVPQPEFEKRVGPEEHFVKEIVFDIPTAADFPRLDSRETSGFDRVIEAILVGDEDSILHKRSYFRLDTRAETATAPAL